MTRYGIRTGTVAVSLLAASLAAGQASAWGFGSQGDGERNTERREERAGNRGGRGMMGSMMSDAAVSACSGKSDGDTCSFTGRRPGDRSDSSLSGACRKMPAGKSDSSERLTCMPKPKNGEGFGRRGDGQENRSDRVANMKQRKQKEIDRIEARVDRIIAYLKSKNVDTGTIESEYATFKTKSDTVIAKVEALQTLLATDNPSESDVETARTAVRTAGKDMITYYRGTLRVALKNALDALND